ncbi:vesicle transport through interaction with t-SNAREs 1a isoform X1 [Rhodnius prolixus]|uniref:V-SNARE domain-containing protein n=1 Tax=Rhodnius prolixus TaxID=13249 RepID=T1I8I6_RHOPR
MASLLEHYEQQYAVSTADFTAKLAKLSKADRADRKFLLQELDKQIEELKELLEQMDLEVRDVEATVRPKLKTRIDSYRAELTRLEHEFKIKNSTNSNDGYMSQGELFGELSLREEQKQRLLDSSERIERTNNKLVESYSILLETEDVGNNILRDLHSQKETIQNSRARLREVDTDLSRSSRILGAMMARSRQHKVVIAAVGVILVIVIAFSIYYSIIRTR